MSPPRAVPPAAGALLAAAVFLCAAGSGAFTVRAFGRPACHEEMTRDAFLALLDEGFDAGAIVPLPASDRWEGIAAYLGEDLFAGAGSDAGRFALFSLILGVRHPDLRGASASDIRSLREIHSDPDGQDAHFLRGFGDDFAAGDLAAAGAGEGFVRERLAAARAFLGLAPDGQIVEIAVFVEFYGDVLTPVWVPAYEFGMALHAVQDSFSHAVRSDDLSRIYQIANYVEAVTDGYDADRDGVRHSWAMDRCREEAAELAAAAAPAFGEFVGLLASAGDGGWPEPALTAFFERWMTVEPGCDRSNDFCGSRWAALARTDPSMPLLEQAFGCGAAPGGAPAGALPWLALLLALALVARRAAAGRRGSGGGR